MLKYVVHETLFLAEQFVLSKFESRMNDNICYRTDLKSCFSLTIVALGLFIDQPIFSVKFCITCVCLLYFEGCKS